MRRLLEDSWVQWVFIVCIVVLGNVLGNPNPVPSNPALQPSQPRTLSEVFENPIYRDIEK
jgi:uncharacterized protein YqcC (DUF446 family)